MNLPSLLQATLLLTCLLLAPAVAAQPNPEPPQQPPDGPMLGINIITPEMQPDLPPGVTLLEPIEDGPAVAAGLASLDRIIKIDKAEIREMKNLQDLLKTYSIGDVIEIEFQRGEEVRTTKLTLGSRAAIQARMKQRNALVGMPMPPFEVSEWVNGPVDPAQLKGKVVVIHFFEMLCAGSLGYSLPRIARWSEKYGKFTDFALVGIHSVWESPETQTPEALKEFVARRQIKYPVGIDQHHKLMNRCVTLHGYRIITEDDHYGTPGTVVIDKDGIVRYKKCGNFDDAEVEKLIDDLLAKPAGGEPPK